MRVGQAPPFDGGQPLPVLVPYRDLAGGARLTQHHLPPAVEGDPVGLVQSLDHTHWTLQLQGGDRHEDREGGPPERLSVHLDRHVVVSPGGGRVLHLVGLVPGDGDWDDGVADEGD